MNGKNDKTIEVVYGEVEEAIAEDADLARAEENVVSPVACSVCGAASFRRDGSCPRCSQTTLFEAFFDLAQIDEEAECMADDYDGNEDLMYRLPDGTRSTGARDHWFNIASGSLDRAISEKSVTHALLFDSFVSFVLKSVDQASLRRALFRVVVVCFRWIADIDFREREEKAHAEAEGRNQTPKHPQGSQ